MVARLPQTTKTILNGVASNGTAEYNFRIPRNVQLVSADGFKLHVLETNKTYIRRSNCGFHHCWRDDECPGIFKLKEDKLACIAPLST